MYDQIREDPLYIMLFAVVIAMAMMASCYLLFRRANAIAPDVTPPLRSLLCQPSTEPHVVYADLLSHLSRGCQVV